MSSPILIIGLDRRYIRSYRTNKNGLFENMSKKKYSSGTNFKQILAIRGTRYFFKVQNDNKIYGNWVDFTGKINFDDEEEKIIDPNFTKVESIAYQRLNPTEFRFVAVETNNGNNKFSKKDFNLNEFNFLRTGITLKEENNNDCDPADTYMKDRCFYCSPGRVLHYSFGSNDDFLTSCEVVDNSITDDYLDISGYDAVQTCFSDPNLCQKCEFERSCSNIICTYPYFFNTPSNECKTCPIGCHSCDPDTLVCLSCKSYRPYLQDGLCEEICHGQFTYEIGSQLNSCSKNYIMGECSRGSISFQETGSGGACTPCFDSFVRRENICIKSCPYGEVNVDGNCVSCPAGTFATVDQECTSECSDDEVQTNGSCTTQCSINEFSQNYECIPNEKCLDYYKNIGNNCTPLICDPSIEFFTPTDCQSSCSPNQIYIGLRYCQQCQDGKSKKENECLEDCGNTYYSDSDNIFQKCEPPLVVQQGKCLPCGEGMEYNVFGINCIPILKEIKIIEKYFMKLSQKIFIKFNSLIELSKNKIDLVTFKIKGEEIQINYLKEINLNELEISLNLTKSLENEILLIDYIKNDNTPLIFNTDDNSIFSNFPIEIPISIYIDDNAGLGESTSQAGSITVLALIVPLLLSNPVAMVSLVRLLQSFGYLSFINVNLPLIVQQIIVQFEINPGRLFPSLFSKFFIDDSAYNCNIHPKLQENDVNCIAVTSLLMNIVVLVIVGLFKIFVYLPVFFSGKTHFLNFTISDILRSRTSSPSPSPIKNISQAKESDNKKNSLILRTICKLNTSMNLSFYFSLLKSMEIDIFLNSWATMKSLGTPDFWSISSNFVLMFFFTNNLLYSILIIRVFVIHILPIKPKKIYNLKKMIVIKKKIIEEEKINSEDLFQFGDKSMIDFFNDQLKENSRFGILIFIAYSLRDMLLPLMLIYFVEFPAIQLFAAIFFNSMTLIILLCTRPLASMFDTVLEIFNNVIFLLLLLLYSIIFVIGDRFSEKQKSLIFGYSIIFLLFLMTITNIIYCSVQGIVGACMTLNQFLSKKKSKKIENNVDKDKEMEVENSQPRTSSNIESLNESWQDLNQEISMDNQGEVDGPNEISGRKLGGC